MSYYGFSLMEMLLALMMSSLLMMGLGHALPQLQQQSILMARQHRLMLALNQALFSLVKDMRRAGFIATFDDIPIIEGIQLFTGSGGLNSVQKSCVLITYDLNRNGVIDREGSIEPETIGYRWRNQMLEQQRGVTTCDSSGWEKLLDPNEVVINDFIISLLPNHQNPKYLSVSIEAHWLRYPKIRYQVREFIYLNNATGKK